MAPPMGTERREDGPSRPRGGKPRNPGETRPRAGKWWKGRAPLVPPDARKV